MAAATAASASASDSSPTPRPSTGMVWSSLSVTEGIAAEVMSPVPALCPDGPWIGTQPKLVAQRRHGGHALPAQLEIEHVEVAHNTLGGHRLRHDYMPSPICHLISTCAGVSSCPSGSVGQRRESARRQGRYWRTARQLCSGIGGRNRSTTSRRTVPQEATA